MNWSRGLLRMWVAFTVLWVGGWVVALYLDRPQGEEPVQPAVAENKVSKDRWIIEDPKWSNVVTFDDLIPTLAQKRRVFWKETVRRGRVGDGRTRWRLYRWLGMPVDRPRL